MWLGYLITLAPTVTLWDAGEFITAAKTLGIPHPPGTPLWVLLGHVWGGLVAVGRYAWRLNLMSASFSAAGAACLFLVVHRVLRDEPALLRLGGAAAGAVLAAFTFTAWQNSNEAEVYMVAVFSIAAISWLCLVWRDRRGTERAAQVLVLIAYVAALSIGNHLLTLLVGPAVSAFVFHVLRTAPSPDPAERRAEWSEWAVLSALWVLLIAVGLGSTPLLWLGGILCAAATIWAATVRSVVFPLAALAVAAVGVSTYAFLYIRSGLDPILDMADPETWSRLVSVIRREQYPARGLLDDPRFLPGPENPGRSPVMFLRQLVNYAQYFSWQWGRLLGQAEGAGAVVFGALGLAGLADLRRRDRSAWWLLGVLWFVTGFGLVVYMNFKPGFSLFWDQYPTMDEHEVRERDYFFTVSFQAWGLLAALGLVALARRLGRAGGGGERAASRPWAAWVLAAALLPFALNFTAASRRHGLDATLARDFAYNMLQSVEPYGVIFSYGDNDTYPLWYAQEVEGVRQDVVNVNLSLANIDWYLRQLRDRPIRPYDASAGPLIYLRDGRPPPAPTAPVLGVSDDLLARMAPVQLDRDVVFRAGGLELPLQRGLALYVRDQAILLILEQQLRPGGGGRPVTFGISSGRGAWLGLEPNLIEQGLALKVFPGRPDTVPGVIAGIQGLSVDTARTAYLVDRVFRFGRLLEADTLVLEPSARQVVTSMAVPFLELAPAAALRGDRPMALTYLRRAQHLAPSAGLARLLAQVESVGLDVLVPQVPAPNAGSRTAPTSKPRARP
ncbi:MAG: glycosyltransferase family 117 protein [Gemmatimonadales bacterium]